MFYREGLLAPRPTPKMEGQPSSAVHDCLFNLFAAALHIGGRSSIRNLTRQAVVTGTHYMGLIAYRKHKREKCCVKVQKYYPQQTFGPQHRKRWHC